MTLRLGIPSKGRLQADTFNWFAARGLNMTRTGSDRGYTAQVDGIDGIELVLLPAGEVPAALRDGSLHLGVTGADMIRERLGDWSHWVDNVAEMGFGHADLVIAVPDFWIDVDTLDDLDAAAAQFRAEHGFRLRIATKYHGLVRAFLRDAGVADYQLIDSQGATEGTIRNEVAESIADITSTGSTLHANGLKVLSDGLILQSQAGLWRARAADWDGAATAALASLQDRIANLTTDQPRP